MNGLKIFENEQFGSIRTVEIDSTPYFVGKDVAEALGYAKPENAISTHVDEDDKTTTLIQGTGSNYKSKAVIINESGVYALVFGSKLPKAKEFKRWVTNDVLPTIRKHGLYATDDLINNPDLAIKAFTALKEEREKAKLLTEKVAIQEQQIIEMQPKVTYYDIVLNCKDLVTITTIAKDYGKSGQWMNETLHELGIQYKQGKIWLLYQKHAEQGYTSTKTSVYDGTDGDKHTAVHTYWTQKGRLFIYDTLKANGILPLIECSED